MGVFGGQGLTAGGILYLLNGCIWGSGLSAGGTLYLSEWLYLEVGAESWGYIVPL